MSAQSQNKHNVLSFFFFSSFVIRFHYDRCDIWGSVLTHCFPQFEAGASLEFLPLLICLLSIVSIQVVGSNGWYFWSVPMLVPNYLYPFKRGESAINFYSARPEDMTEELFSNLENILGLWDYYLLLNIHPPLGRISLLYLLSYLRNAVTGKAQSPGQITSPWCYSPASRLILW